MGESGRDLEESWSVVMDRAGLRQLWSCSELVIIGVGRFRILGVEGKV